MKKLYEYCSCRYIILLSNSCLKSIKEGPKSGIGSDFGRSEERRVGKEC